MVVNTTRKAICPLCLHNLIGTKPAIRFTGHIIKWKWYLGTLDTVIRTEYKCPKCGSWLYADDWNLIAAEEVDPADLEPPFKHTFPPDASDIPF